MRRTCGSTHSMWVGQWRYMDAYMLHVGTQGHDLMRLLLGSCSRVCIAACPGFSTCRSCRCPPRPCSRATADVPVSREGVRGWAHDDRITEATHAATLHALESSMPLLGCTQVHTPARDYSDAAHNAHSGAVNYLKNRCGFSSYPHRRTCPHKPLARPLLPLGSQEAHCSTVTSRSTCSFGRQQPMPRAPLPHRRGAVCSRRSCAEPAPAGLQASQGDPQP